VNRGVRRLARELDDLFSLRPGLLQPLANSAAAWSASVRVRLARCRSTLRCALAPFERLRSRKGEFEKRPHRDPEKTAAVQDHQADCPLDQAVPSRSRAPRADGCAENGRNHLAMNAASDPPRGREEARLGQAKAEHLSCVISSRISGWRGIDRSPLPEEDADGRRPAPTAPTRPPTYAETIDLRLGRFVRWWRPPEG